MHPDPCVWDLKALETLLEFLDPPLITNTSRKAIYRATRPSYYALPICILLRALYHNLIKIKHWIHFMI